MSSIRTLTTTLPIVRAGAQRLQASKVKAHELTLTEAIDWVSAQRLQASKVKAHWNPLFPTGLESGAQRLQASKVKARAGTLRGGYSQRCSTPTGIKGKGTLKSSACIAALSGAQRLQASKVKAPPQRSQV